MRGTKFNHKYVSTMCLITLVLTSGCAGPLIRSQRLPYKQVETVDGHPHEHRQRLRDVARAVRPYVAGPFYHRRHHATQYAAEQATIQPPHSKFHPVPTRPVFEPRDSYSPPRPIVNLVPVPEPNPHLHGMPGMVYPDIGLPPTPGALGDEGVILGPVESYEGESMPLVAPNE